MKAYKRISAFLLSLVVLLSFCFQSSSAKVNKKNASYELLNAKKITRSFKYADFTENSYASASATTYQAAESDLKCASCAVNEHYGSIFDNLYVTAAYVSLTVELESGKSYFSDRVVSFASSTSVTAELEASTLGDYKSDDVIENFKSVHQVYHYLPKYRIEFHNKDLAVQTIIIEKHYTGD